MTTIEKLVTVEEFARLPDPRDGGKMELVDGRVVVMSPVGRRHGQIAGYLYETIEEFVGEHALGEVGFEVGFRLVPGRQGVRAPDVHFVEASRVPGLPDDGFIDGPPTLAIEVISPEDRANDIQQKVNDYLAAGTTRVWVVEPKTKTVTVHHPGGDSHTFQSGETLASGDAAFATAGFALPLDDLFA
ncbi:MAG TPA: Uma2 family endonuclease [Tepidiformaceae bacterium]|nr:Uma2 family endonuclease [Tepidiformaceae bacterium]